MEFPTTLKVLVSGLALSALVCVSSASFCQHGKQYLNTTLNICVNCTVCTKNVVIRPCEIHRDTKCGTIGELLDFDHHLLGDNPHRHPRRHKDHHHRNSNKQDIVWQYGEDVGRRRGEATATELPPLLPPEQDITSTEAPFSSAETLVWDWQAIALSSAVFACILFFLAMTLYSLHQAKQWRRLKDNFEADVEDLSARLSLMAAASSTSSSSASAAGANTGEKGEIVDARIGPISDGNYLNNRCVYLEQLLNVRKDTKIGSENGGGNVYIEESSSAAASSPPVAQHQLEKDIV